MTDKPAAPPSPWARRMQAMLKRLVKKRIESLERRAKLRQGPKPRRGRKRKTGAAAK
jgi:hypothetical protein